MLFRSDPPIQTLFARLGSLLSSLFRSEIELAKAEATEKAWQLAFGAGAIVGGSLIALTGVIVLVEALIAALSAWIGLHPAFGALLATLVIAVAAVCLVVAGIRRLRPSGLVPRRTIASLERDRELIEALRR